MDKKEEKLQFLKNLIEADNWINVLVTNQVVTQKKALEGSNINCFRSYGTIHMEYDDLISYILNVYENLENVRQYDPDIVEYDILAEYDESIMARQINSLPWPLYPRESVYIQVLHEDKTDKAHPIAYIYMYSVESDLAPIDESKAVRANINISAYVVEKLDNSCFLQRIAHVEPLGSIPTMVINSYANKTATMILKLQ